MRHAIANGLYAIAEAIDTRRARLQDMDVGLDFGDERKWEDDPRDTTTLNYHAGPKTTVTASFKPGRFTYAALTIGRGREVTIFLDRRFTRRVIDVLRGIEGAYARFGEDRP